MKNWIVILAIFLIPLGLYGFLDTKGQCSIKEEQAQAMNSQNPKIIKFSSPMCSECVKTSAEMKKAVEEFSGNVVVEEMDVLKVSAKEAVKKYKISLVPTLIFLDKQGNIVKKQEGYMSSAEIVKVLDGIK
ncbi:thioredoxin family protein [bacterium]|nr:thioredoxin family protein [bacterium]